MRGEDFHDLKHQNAILAALCVFAALVLAYCAHEQHRARLAVEALAAAQEGPRLVSTVYVMGVETQAITIAEPGWTEQQLTESHNALLKALE